MRLGEFDSGFALFAGNLWTLAATAYMTFLEWPMNGQRTTEHKLILQYWGSNAIRDFVDASLPKQHDV